jgi:hypothetical protein
MVEWASEFGTIAKAVVNDTPAGLQTRGRVTVPVDDVSIKEVDLEGRPVAGAAIKFAGRDVGSTDSHGVIIVRQVPLDNDYPGPLSTMTSTSPMPWLLSNLYRRYILGKVVYR